MPHFVYIIFSESAGLFYIGETMNVEERIKQHNSGIYKSAFSKRATDWKLFWSLQCVSRKQALRIEKHIKKMRNKKYYQNLTKYPELGISLLTKFKD